MRVSNLSFAHALEHVGVDQKLAKSFENGMRMNGVKWPNITTYTMANVNRIVRCYNDRIRKVDDPEDLINKIEKLFDTLREEKSDKLFGLRRAELQPPRQTTSNGHVKADCFERALEADPECADARCNDKMPVSNLSFAHALEDVGVCEKLAGSGCKRIQPESGPGGSHQ